MKDMAELERIYSEHASPLRRLLRVLIPDPAVAEDLRQETFLQFWRQHARFDPGRASLRAYLFWGSAEESFRMATPPAVFVKHELTTPEAMNHFYPNDKLMQVSGIH